MSDELDIVAAKQKQDALKAALVRGANAHRLKGAERETYAKGFYDAFKLLEPQLQDPAAALLAGSTAAPHPSSGSA